MPGNRFVNSKRPRRFKSVEHLSPEAIAALVDDELMPTAHHRAYVHLLQCESCRAEVKAQRDAVALLMDSTHDDSIRAPRELLDKLAGIAAQPIEDEPLGTTYGHPEDLFDRLETYIRAFKSLRQRGRRQ